MERLDFRGIRATRAIVDLDAIAGNVRAIRSVLPAPTNVMAVVKADGYGHGAAMVAQAALEAGATCLGVATVSEGRALRIEGIRAPIVLISSIDPDEALLACNLGLEITIAHAELLKAVQIAARAIGNGAPVSIHLKIDTGLRRYGALPEDALALAARIARDPNLSFAGIFTHFASADELDEPFTGKQRERFERVVAAIGGAGIQLPALHVANSAGILTGQGIDFDVVRLGIALYGVPPSAEVPLLPDMRSALRIESRITRVLPIEPGDTVGYNRTFRAREATRAALIPIGYADGYRRSLAGRSWVGLQGKRAPVLGRISMDQIVVEVPRGIPAEVGDVVHVLGDDAASGAPSITEMAELMDTNVYEVLVGVRQRVPRIYLRGGEEIGARIAGDAFTSAW